MLNRGMEKTSTWRAKEKNNGESRTPTTERKKERHLKDEDERRITETRRRRKEQQQGKRMTLRPVSMMKENYEKANGGKEEWTEREAMIRDAKGDGSY